MFGLNILYNTLVSVLPRYISEISWLRQCEFRRSRSTTGQIFCVLQVLEKKVRVYWDSTSVTY